ncbi:MAG: prolipoprotein diacylglyceryl transferase [Candidatus Andersenbacteria bacterium]|nr:prolipoprotein diacylglyceryl transferase [Candidatus Andersenbacteria bacterium]
MIEFFPSRTIAISFGQFAIHWYGIMYAAAFWIAYALLPYLGRLRGLNISRDSYTWLIVYGALGVLIGGRLGYAVFYEPGFFISHSLYVFAIWLGGMSSHGGFIGVAVAIWLWVKKEKVDIFAIADIITVPVAIGLALGRFGNFINQELYRGYDAFWDIGAMLVTAIICYVMLRKGSKQGFVIATFLVVYSVSRFFLEYLRVQEWPYTIGLTRGQFLTIPVFAIGVLLFLYARSQPRPTTRR